MFVNCRVGQNRGDAIGGVPNVGKARVYGDRRQPQHVRGPEIWHHQAVLDEEVGGAPSIWVGNSQVTTSPSGINRAGQVSPEGH